MKQDALDFINSTILSQAKGLRYKVSKDAPSSEIELFNSPSLVIWDGASDNTIFQDASVNWALRALHDTLHIETRCPFQVDAEIELGKLQASQYESDLMRELVYCEISLQSLHFKKTGEFVSDQYSFTLSQLIKQGVLK